jgi:hypothetical protein
MSLFDDNASRRVEMTKEPNMSLTIRRATAEDALAVRRLAVLDSAFPPTGQVLLAEMGDELWAALSMETGATVADPFRPTSDVVDLLRFRAGRLSGESRPHGRVLARVLPRAA